MSVLRFLTAITGALMHRWPEIRAEIGWAIDSWIRPTDAEAEWEQQRSRKP
jgi:hypothetical protein